MLKGIEDIRLRTWDFALTIVTVVLLGSLGVQSFIGTVWMWWAQARTAGWEQFEQPAFIDLMNTIATPQLIALVIVMGLCVPKRLLSRSALVLASGGMVAIGIGAWAFTGSAATGVTVYLALAALIQVAVVILTAAGARGPSYLTEGRLTKLGSGLLHLGFIVFGIVIAALQRSTWMLPVFWTSTVLVMVGTCLSFYADRLSWAARHRPAPRTDEPDDSDYRTD